MGQLAKRSVKSSVRKSLILAALIFFSGNLWASASEQIDSENFQSVDFDGGARFLQQLIYFPKNIAEQEALPLIVISHGNGHNYKYYKHLQEYLTPRGYIVMSHANQTGPGIQTAAQSTLDNTDLFLASLEKISGGALVGKVDASRIGFIGHSRGAEGVVRAYTRLQDGDFMPKHFHKDNIQFISSIAPTTFLSAEDVDPRSVNYNLFVGGADGDVDGRPQQVLMSMPIYERAKGEKTLIYVQAAGHNVFNDESRDEGTGPDRLDRDVVHKISRATHLALAEMYLKGQGQHRLYFQENWFHSRPPEVPVRPQISNEYKRAENDTSGVIIDNFQSEKSTDKASSGAKIVHDVDGLFEGQLQDQDGRFRFSPKDAMNGLTRYLDNPEPPIGLSFQWEDDRKLVFDFSEAAKNLQGFSALSLRAAQMSRHPLTIELADVLSFSVGLTDGLGHQAVLSTEGYGMIIPPYARSGGWATEFNILRMSINDFKTSNPELDLTSIQTLEFYFGPASGSPVGSLVLDDVEFVR